MSDPFLAEVRMFPYSFAPLNWAFCNGQLMPIAQSTALFALIGSNFGGNGTTNFALPSFQDSLVIGAGQRPGYTDYVLGETGGNATVTLSALEMPRHTHTVNTMSDPGTFAAPAANEIVARSNGANAYDTVTTQLQPMAPQSLSPFGSVLPQPHTNLMPSLTVNYCIALVGVFPQRP